MRYLSQKTPLLFLCMAQLFVPMFNLAFALPCDETPAEMCKVASCCAAEASARMDCCEVQASPVRTEPAPAAPVIPQRIYFDLAAPISFVEAGDELEWTANPDYALSFFNTHFSGNQLYKFLAVFLI